MFNKKRFCFIARAFFPASHKPGAAEFHEDTLLEGFFPYIAKAKNLDEAVQQVLDASPKCGGSPFLIYHIPGNHSMKALIKLAALKPDERVAVWEDRTRMTAFDLIVDYTIPDFTQFGESKNDRLKLKTYTIEDAVAVAKAMVERKGGTPCAIHHLLGDHTLAELEAIAEGKLACVTRMVWFDEEAAMSSMTGDDFFRELEQSENRSAAEALVHEMLYDARGVDSPGIFIPPTSLRREAM